MQPVEFAKIGTALMLANYVAGPDFNIKIRNPCGQLLQLLRFLQLLFLQFRMWDLFWYLVHFIALYREGLSGWLFGLGFLLLWFS